MGKIYRYYNRNPDGHILNDCVCKAISTATDLNYAAVNNLLDISASLNNCDQLCVCCYHKLLEDILCYERVDCKFKNTVEDIARKYRDEKLIVRIQGHLTAIIKGEILDIWDCSGRYVDCFWFVV